jgi:threonine dehydrogenase-like Zn-dependent dehydrogenase
MRACGVNAVISRATSVAIERTQDNRFIEVARSVPAPEPGELLLGIETAGVCGTDIQIVKGMRSEVATVLGHEACCTVLAVGERWASQFADGDRVAINPTSATDPNFLLGHSVDGVWSSHLLVTEHAVELGQVVPLPESLDPVLAVLVEPLACAIYSWSMLQQARPERVLVLGDGTVGRLVSWLATGCLGPGSVMLAGRTDMEDDRARARVLHGMRGRTGVVIATPRDSTAACVTVALENAGAGSVIDVIGGLDAGSDPTLQRVIDVRAQNVCGFPREPKMLTLDMGAPEALRRLRVTGHRGVSTEHLRAAADLLLRNGADLGRLITHLATPAEAIDALNDISDGGVRSMAGRRILKLVIDFRGATTA